MRKLLLSFLLVLITHGLASAQQGELLAYADDGLRTASKAAEWSTPIEDPVQFYPNPVKDYLNVKFPNKGVHKVVVYNLLGEEMASKEVFDSDLVKIDLSMLPKGMYFVSYEAAPGQVVTKMFSKSQ